MTYHKDLIILLDTVHLLIDVASMDLTSNCIPSRNVLSFWLSKKRNYLPKMVAHHKAGCIG